MRCTASRVAVGSVSAFGSSFCRFDPSVVLLLAAVTPLYCSYASLQWSALPLAASGDCAPASIRRAADGRTVCRHGYRQPPTTTETSIIRIKLVNMDNGNGPFLSLRMTKDSNNGVR